MTPQHHLQPRMLALISNTHDHAALQETPAVQVQVGQWKVAPQQEEHRDATPDPEEPQHPEPPMAQWTQPHSNHLASAPRPSPVHIRMPLSSHGPVRPQVKSAEEPIFSELKGHLYE